MKQDLSEDILIKYLLREAGAAEIKEVEAWVAAGTANAKKLEGIKIILESSSRLAQTSPLNEAEAWERFKQKRATGNTAQAKVIPIKTNTRWLRIAAAILFLTGGSWLAYHLYNNRSNSAAWVSVSTQNTVRADTLPDGSVVHINKHSTLSYAGNFKSHRAIKLSGEAFFEVKHDETIPFSVQVNDIRIRDIGTTFNVNGNKQITEVIVESGIVSISNNRNSVKVKAREMVRFKNGDRSFKVERSNDRLYDYYRSNSIKAMNTPLWRLVEVLNEAYSANIEIGNAALRSTPITVTINTNDRLPTILDLLKSTTPEIHIEQKGNTIVLR